MSAEREVGMEKLIDGVWAVFLDKLKKKDVPPARPAFGDELNLFVPQLRMLLPIYANPRFPVSIYTSSYLAARRNAYTVMRKLDMPPDFFWKFEFWTDERAFDVLSKVTNRIFREIMRTTKEGLLSVENASTDPEKIEILLTLDECVECFGIEANHPFCYYHAGTLTGIISALLGKELDGYETACCATGGDKCEFVIGLGRGGDELERYLNPEKIEFPLQKMVENALGGKSLRSLGNDADLRYYQLIILNSIITNPKVFRDSSYEVGVAYGKTLAQFLGRYYNKSEDELLDAISHYYQSLKHLQLDLNESADEVRAAEVAEISGLAQNEDFLGFLFGELEGLLTVATKGKMTYAGNAFEGNELVIKFKRQE
ncbi:MAG TPA: 4-vinyl reductase [Desulfobacteria bacterium]|nr:4-vinyl reductase [Desulfobacteria bacterium]